MSSKQRTIFVNIAAYRDSEAYPSIKDLFEKAKYPGNLHVAICWQYNPLREDPFMVPDRKHQVSVINLDYKKAKGACYARYVTQQLYHGEEYHLQIDAHTRMIPNWDEVMIDELARCPSDKPILSTYPNHYTLPNEVLDHGPYKMIYNLYHGNVPSFHSRACTEEEKLAPTPGLCVSGGFVFSKGCALIEVPYDPYIYFIGEEVTMSARYWTHGYDIFTPSKTMVFHLYAAPEIGKNHHWKDHPDWHDSYESSSRQRVLHLLGYETTTDARALSELERYGMGTARSYAQYEAFSGINVKEQSFNDNAKNGVPTV